MTSSGLPSSSTQRQPRSCTSSWPSADLRRVISPDVLRTWMLVSPQFLQIPGTYSCTLAQEFFLSENIFLSQTMCQKPCSSFGSLRQLSSHRPRWCETGFLPWFSASSQVPGFDGAWDASEDFPAMFLNDGFSLEP